MYHGDTFRYIYLRMHISNPASVDRWEEVGVLADLAFRLSIIPRSILDSLNIYPEGRRRFRALGGRERETAGVVLRYKDSISAVPIVVGDDGETPMLGLRALESLGYQIDYTTGELKSIELLF
jgi:predicted aspartyl protease